MADEEDQGDEILAFNEICCENIKSCKIGPDPDFEDFKESTRKFFKRHICGDVTFCHAGSLYVSPDLRQEPVLIKYVNNNNVPSEFKVNHLPPFCLDFLMPRDYPSIDPPTFDLHACWLPKPRLMDLKRKMVEIWEENQGSVVLFLWQNFLREDCLDFLGIQESREIDMTRTNRRRNPTVVKLLKDFHAEMEEKEFHQGMFDCDICFNQKSGAKCIKFAGEVIST